MAVRRAMAAMAGTAVSGRRPRRTALTLQQSLQPTSLMGRVPGAGRPVVAAGAAPCVPRIQ